MSIKFWEGGERKDLFVRFDRPKPGNTSVCVWVCDERGVPVEGGCLVDFDGHRRGSILYEIATRAGVELESGNIISPGSLAQICAEMAKRIQGD